MRLIVTGDLHIHEKNIRELGRILDKMYSRFLTGLDDGCDGIIILGDVFDSIKPSPKEVEFFISFIRSIPPTKLVYIISGNHEESKDTEGCRWVKLLHPQVMYSRSCLTTKVNGYQVVMKHTNVLESKMGPDDKSISGESYTSFNDVDIVMLGHIHKAQIINYTIGKYPMVFHPGSPIYFNFGERNDIKGYYILDLDRQLDHPKLIWTPTDCVPMKQIEFNGVTLLKAESVLDSLISTHHCNLQEGKVELKLKVLFNVPGNKVDILTHIRDLIKKYQDRFFTFSYKLKTQERVVTVNKQNKHKDITQLFKDFCKQDKVEKDIANLIKPLI